MYRIHYIDINGWERFMDGYNCLPRPDGFEGDMYDRWMDAELKKHNGRDIKNSPFVEFETEEDAVAFLLKFG